MRLDRREFLQVGLAAGLAAAIPPLHARMTATAPIAGTAAEAPPDEDGYELWLRYRPVVDADLLAHYRAATANIVVRSPSPLAQSIADELDRACQGMLNQRPASAAPVTATGTIFVGAPNSSPDLRTVIDPATLATLGDEGFILKTTPIDGHAAIVIAANH